MSDANDTINGYFKKAMQQVNITEVGNTVGRFIDKLDRLTGNPAVGPIVMGTVVAMAIVVMRGLGEPSDEADFAADPPEPPRRYLDELDEQCGSALMNAAKVLVDIADGMPRLGVSLSLDNKSVLLTNALGDYCPRWKLTTLSDHEMNAALEWATMSYATVDKLMGIENEDRRHRALDAYERANNPGHSLRAAIAKLSPQGDNRIERLAQRVLEEGQDKISLAAKVELIADLIGNHVLLQNDMSESFAVPITAGLLAKLGFRERTDLLLLAAYAHATPAGMTEFECAEYERVAKIDHVGRLSRAAIEAITLREVDPTSGAISRVFTLAGGDDAGRVPTGTG